MGNSPQSQMIVISRGLSDAGVGDVEIVWSMPLSHTAALAVSTLVSSCIAVGPDYLHPAPPEAAGYAGAPRPDGLGSRPDGGAPTFAYGGDLPEQWWRLFQIARPQSPR